MYVNESDKIIEIWCWYTKFLCFPVYWSQYGIIGLSRHWSSHSVLNALLEGWLECICIPDLLEVDIVAAGPMVHDAGLSATEYQEIKQGFRNRL